MTKDREQPIYLDNAATSWPKSEETYGAMDAFSREIGGSPGRSGHRKAIDSARIIYNTRESLARLMGVSDPSRIALLKNATEGLNIAVRGILKPGDHAIVSGMEHNAVMRPLTVAVRRGVEFTVLPASPEGETDPGEIRKAVKVNTRALFLIHASNVTGTIMPVAEAGRTARELGILFCVDVSQSAGIENIDVDTMNADLLAFTGHKSLLGPQGTGGLYIREGLESRLEPLMQGGTGSMSEHLEQPDFMPDRYESGTLNTPGFAGLGAGVDFILKTGLDAIRKKEMELVALFLEGAGEIRGIRIYGAADTRKRTAAVSFRIEGKDPAVVAHELDERFGIMSRAGLHCAPLAHRSIGTFPLGTTRVSFGYFNTMEDVRRLLKGLEVLSRD